MKRTRTGVVATALLAGVIALGTATSASADSTPQPHDIVGGGSDTTQVSLNNVADGVAVGGSVLPGYNAAALGRLVSFDAVDPVTGLVGAAAAPITLKVGTAPITRPNNTGTGRALLYPTTGNAAANYARASSSLSAADITAGLVQFPFAVDGIQTARRAAGSNAPANLTRAQLASIYLGNVTNWNQVGGQSGAIVPLLPYEGSGTRNTFISQLAAEAGMTDSQFVSNLAPSVVEVQEHDAGPIQSNVNAIGPFSTGRAASESGISLISGWSFQRALYNVVRGAEQNSAFAQALFGSEGFICSSAAQPLIEASGFLQLAGPADGGVCGVAGTAAPSPAQLALTN